MKKKKIFIFVFYFCIVVLVNADDFRWNLVNALARDSFTEVEDIMKNIDINKLSDIDRRMIMNFVLTYSRRDTALQSLKMLSGYGITPGSYELYTALNMNQSDEIIDYILENDVTPNGEILLVVTGRQRFNFARRFLENYPDNNIDVNFSYPLARSYADGMTPLLYAAKWNNFDLVKLLLERGANINARNREGETALSLAHSNGNTEMYNFLMERGASESNFAPSNTPPPANPALLTNQNPLSTSGGMSSLLNNQINNQIEFQRGTYRLTGGNITIRFTGAANAGSISYVINGMPSSGVYRIEDRVLTIAMEGHSFIYRIDSATSFSGNGEVWVRTGN